MWMVRTILFFLALSLAAVSDVRKRIIPDWIPCLVAAVSLIPPGKPSMLGLLACLPLLIAGITTGGIGGGDVKLMAAGGCFLGAEKILASVVPAIFSAGAYCLYLLIVKRAGRNTIFSLGPFLCLGMVAVFIIK